MKLLVWGTGQLAWQVVRHINPDDVIGYVDTYACQNDTFADKPLLSPAEIKQIEFDAILVSTIYGKEIKEECIKNDIDESKVIYCYGGCSIEDYNTDYDFVNRVLGGDFCETIKNRYHLIRDIDADLNDYNTNYKALLPFKKEKIYRSDYIRIRTLSLLSKEIKRKRISGAVAEFGVYRGDFAIIINHFFQDSILYLFDTFEGFPEDELNKELEGGTKLTIRDAFLKTSVDLVMSRMEFPEKVVIRKGFFPETAKGLEEEFSFVSIDCDWEESLYQGVKYFYPHLIAGGYIIIHDYNNNMAGARRALDRYENDYNCVIPRVPICDAGGSVVLTK